MTVHIKKVDTIKGLVSSVDNGLILLKGKVDEKSLHFNFENRRFFLKLKSFVKQ